MPAADDEVLGATCQNQPLVFREVADVAGDEPAIVGQHVDVVLRIDIAREYLRSLNHDQAAGEFGAVLQ